MFHPAFLYASLWSLLTFVILLRLARKHRQRLYTGDITAVYFLLFAIGRILLELVRLDSRSFVIGGLDLVLPVATVVSIVIGIAMAALLLWRHVLSKPPVKA
jgi:prolipoprotein diacylglyceryltransferase